MKEFLASAIITFLSLLLIDNFSRSVKFNGYGTVFVLSLVINLLNATVKPLLHVMAVPVTVVTLGLFGFVINGLVLYLAFKLTNGAKIKGFVTAIWMSVVLSILQSIIGSLLQ